MSLRNALTTLKSKKKPKFLLFKDALVVSNVVIFVPVTCLYLKLANENGNSTE